MALQSASWGFTCGGMDWPIRVEKYGLIREDGLPGRAGTWRLLLLLCSLMGDKASSFVSYGVGWCETRGNLWIGLGGSNGRRGNACDEVRHRL